MLQSPADLLGLRGKNFVLVGGGAGLGLAIARHLRGAGAKVFCIDNNLEMAELVAKETGAIPWRADALDRVGLQGAFEAAEQQMGPIRGVVDIIGIAKLKPLNEFDDEAWHWQFSVVLRHAFLVLQVGSRFVETGGNFTFVGSLSGDRVVKQQTIYGTAKAALHHLVRGAALEYAQRRVRVNAVSPGFIRTPRLLQILTPEMWQRVDAAVPLGRAADPADIAGCVTFLASDLAAILTGQIIGADGGVSVAAALPDLEWSPK